MPSPQERPGNRLHSLRFAFLVQRRADIVNIVNSGADMFMLKRFDEKYFLTRISDFLASRKLHNARENGAKHFVFQGTEQALSGTNVQLTEMVLSAFATVVHLLPLVHQD